MSIEYISAITLAVSDMDRSVGFYEKLGFEVIYGSSRDNFVTLQSQEAFVNLILTEGFKNQWWGRAIFRVSSADQQYQKALSAGLKPDPPQNGTWGERYFHITDPDSHELSFAELIKNPPKESTEPSGI